MAASFQAWCYEIEPRIQILGTALVGAAPGLISRCTLGLDLQATDSKAPTTRRLAPIDPSIIATATRGYGSANANDSTTEQMGAIVAPVNPSIC